MDSLTSKVLSRGFSLIEMLIAMGIGIVMIGAMALVVFGGQSLSINGENDLFALSLATAMQEKLEALSELDYNMINPTTTETQESGASFITTVTALPSVDYLEKAVSVVVSWINERGQTLSTELHTVFNNIENAHSGQRCSSVLQGDWSHAVISGPFLVRSVGTTGNPVTEIFPYNKTLFVTTSNTSGHHDDFYVYDLATDPSNPTLLTSLDLNGVSPGINSIAIATTSQGVFAFVGNGNTPNWNTCLEGPSCSHVQVVDISVPSAPVLKRNFKMSTSSAPAVNGSGGQGVVNTVVYKNGYLFVGLSKTGSGPEFVILDVGGGGLPASSTNLVYVGGYRVGRAVNSVYVKKGVAYLGTSDNAQELIALDVHDPAHPTVLSTFNPPGTTNFGAGNVVTGVGTRVLFGRNFVSNAPEFYAIDVAVPSSLHTLVSRDVGVNPNTESVNAMIIRDNLAFIVMSDFLQIWDMGSPNIISFMRTFDLKSLGARGVALGCEQNTLYVGGYRFSDEQGLIYIVSAL